MDHANNHAHLLCFRRVVPRGRRSHVHMAARTRRQRSAAVVVHEVALVRCHLRALLLRPRDTYCGIDASTHDERSAWDWGSEHRNRLVRSARYVRRFSRTRSFSLVHFRCTLHFLLTLPSLSSFVLHTSALLATHSRLPRRYVLTFFCAPCDE